MQYRGVTFISHCVTRHLVRTLQSASYTTEHCNRIDAGFCTSRRAASLDAFRTSGFSALLLLITCVRGMYGWRSAGTPFQLSPEMDPQRHATVQLGALTSSEVPAIERAAVRVVALLFLRAI